MTEKRIDTEDGEAYTWDELAAYYKGKYKKREVEEYWETLKVVKSKGKGKGKDKGKSSKGKAAAPEPKAKTKAKAKAKVKAEEPKAKAKAKAKTKAEAKPKVKAKAKAKAKEAKPAGNFKVVVCGGAGGIGQPLSMLMVMDKNVKELCVFDLSVAAVPPSGVAQDLAHLERKCSVKGYSMEVGKKPIDHLEECLTGADLVLIPAGMPRKPGMTRDDLFKVNADIAKGLCEATAKYCPDAVLGMIVNPVNSIVPAMAELYKKKGLDPMKVIGITTLDIVRANKFAAEETGKNPNYINVPVIGGHAGTTILPLFSQAGKLGLDEAKIPDMDKHVQDAGTDVVNAKGGKGSATLSMAYAGAKFGSSVLAGLSGRKRTLCAYCASTVTDLPYFAQKVTFGEKGVDKVLPIGELNDYEKKRLEEAKTQLKGEIESGLKYAESNSFDF
jgi:malate dehydrogenase